MSKIYDETHPECPVCFNFFTSFKHPIKLGCNHTFCVKCIHHLQSEICPLCRAPFQSSVDDLQPNFEMIEILKKTKKYNCQILIQEQNKEYDLFIIESKANDEYYNDDPPVQSVRHQDFEDFDRYFDRYLYWLPTLPNSSVRHQDFDFFPTLPNSLVYPHPLIELPDLPLIENIPNNKIKLKRKQYKKKEYEQKEKQERLSYIKFVNRQLNRQKHISQQGKSFRRISKLRY